MSVYVNDLSMMVTAKKLPDAVYTRGLPVGIHVYSHDSC